MDNGTKKSCTCKACQGACESKPGWFKPGEAEKVAEHFGVSLEDLFQTSLTVDWWENGPDGRPIFVLSPGVEPYIGAEFPADPRGMCVFFKDGRCEIHAVKPYECREAIHTESHEEHHAHHETAAMAWKGKGHQGQIKELLGRRPVAADYDFLSALLGRW